MKSEFECRIGCGACCIAPSISTPMPGLPFGKPAGQRCAHLTKDNRCELFGRPERPSVCTSLKPCLEMCGTTASEAMNLLERLEILTRPDSKEAVPDQKGSNVKGNILACYQDFDGVISQNESTSR